LSFWDSGIKALAPPERGEGGPCASSGPFFDLFMMMRRGPARKNLLKAVDFFDKVE